MLNNDEKYSHRGDLGCNDGVVEVDERINGSFLFTEWRKELLARMLWKAMEGGFDVSYLLNLLAEDEVKEWLGRRIDRSFINELKEFDFHVSGESGEYHTFGVDCPIFKRRIEVGELE